MNKVNILKQLKILDKEYFVPVGSWTKTKGTQINETKRNRKYFMCPLAEN